ncbi:phasin family protein [Aquisalinus flavus]|uniref:Phasin domain-containing protein n=1 Tax=Aquisalinus flavus TaxID=1526572 RepID=A0A8J2Y3X8_9PROT|nr:phasin family protein [Aquisalinus flavus]MBD0426034.1 phasin family protein [Aquisalinus flavus]UNE48375.1 phasin family protein [Aquisalinus flavus]GGD11249.1 hypothetical protein GCM10011342_20060 [Aquisalinus flavus]
MARKESANPTTASIPETASLKEIEPFPVFDPAEFLKIGNRNLEVATRATTAYLSGAARFNKEIVDFVNGRVRKDIKAAQDIMSARDSEQAYHCHAQFLNTAIRDYADEGAKMLDIIAEAAGASLAPVEERTEEVLHYIDEHGTDRVAAAE